MQDLNKHAKGYTLIELLVVLVVISIIAGIAVMSVGNASRDIWQSEVTRLYVLLRQAESDAVLQGLEIGVFINDAQDGSAQFDFSKFDYATSAWVELNDTVYRGSSLPVTLGTSLSPAEEKPAITSESSPAVPTIIFYSDGGVTPFELTLPAPGNGSDFFTIANDGLSETVIRHASS